MPYWKTKLIGDAAELLIGTILYRILREHNPNIEIVHLGGNRRFDLLIKNIQYVPQPYNVVIKRDSYVEVKIRHKPSSWKGMGIPPTPEKLAENKEIANREGYDYLLAYVFYELEPLKYKLWFKFIILNSDIIDREWFIKTRWNKDRREKLIQLSIEKLLKLRPPNAIVLETSSMI